MRDVRVNSEQTQQFGQLRARFEATFSEPAVIVITSANRGDGKTATAFGLAGALAQAEYRVLLIDAGVAAPTLSRIHQLPFSTATSDTAELSKFAAPVDMQPFSGVSLADERFESVMSMDKVRAAVHDARLHFDFTIVDTSPLLKSELAVLFSFIADGTMLTLREGRLPSLSDGETVKTLNRVGANMLGVLSISNATIKTFSERATDAFDRVSLPAARRVRARSVAAPSVREVVDVSPPRARS